MRLYAVFSFGAMPSKILKVKKVKNIPWQSPINCLHAHIITFVLTGRHHTYLDFRNIACTTPCVNPMRVSARAKKLSTKKAEVPWPQWAPHAPVTWYRYLLRPVLYGPWFWSESIPGFINSNFKYRTYSSDTKCFEQTYPFWESGMFSLFEAWTHSAACFVSLVKTCKTILPEPSSFLFSLHWGIQAPNNTPCYAFCL